MELAFPCVQKEDYNICQIGETISNYYHCKVILICSRSKKYYDYFYYVRPYQVRALLIKKTTKEGFLDPTLRSMTCIQKPTNQKGVLSNSGETLDAESNLGCLSHKYYAYFT